MSVSEHNMMYHTKTVFVFLKGHSFIKSCTLRGCG